jgi:thiamine kinase-like enzyme
MIKKSFLSFLLGFCTLFGLFGQHENDQKVLRIAQQLLSGQNEEIRLKKLGGGLTNDNYKVCLGPICYFFRTVNQANSALGSSLEREWMITKKISVPEIAPKVIFYSPEDGVLVTDFIQTKAQKIDLHDNMTMQKFCRLISSLHHLQTEFPTEYDPFSNIENFLAYAQEISATLPKEVEEIILPEIISFKKMHAAELKIEKKPAHLDLHAGNILDDGKKLWLIDWEYAAMADPFFDLATLTSVENFTNLEMNNLLECYLERKPTKEEVYYFYRMRILADARWALWSYIQAKISPLDEPFEEFGNAYFQHCLEKIHDLHNFNFFFSLEQKHIH